MAWHNVPLEAFYSKREKAAREEAPGDVRFTLFNERLVILSVFSVRGEQSVRMVREQRAERGTNLAHLSFR